jgi:DeoR/GlpR family transcriptional regulator of sugar metabolism
VPNELENVPNELANVPNKLRVMFFLIKTSPKITYEQLAKDLNISRETVRRYMNKLRNDYKIISRVGGTKGHWIVLKK